MYYYHLKWSCFIGYVMERFESKDEDTAILKKGE